MEYIIMHDLYINSSAAEIYDAISLPERINNWWTKQCEGLRKKGATYNLFFSEDYDWLAEVTEIEQNKHFELTMTRSNEGWPGTRFGYRIIEDDDRCLLSFYHSGWSEPNPKYRHTSYCWALILNGLKTYIEEGRSIPFDERS